MSQFFRSISAPVSFSCRLSTMLMVVYLSFFVSDASAQSTNTVDFFVAPSANSVITGTGEFTYAANLTTVGLSNLTSFSFNYSQPVNVPPYFVGTLDTSYGLTDLSSFSFVGGQTPKLSWSLNDFTYGTNAATGGTTPIVSYPFVNNNNLSENTSIVRGGIAYGTFAFNNGPVTFSPGLITTNQYASPCINSSTCAASSTINGPNNINTGSLLIGTGGGIGTLAVGAATLNSTSLSLGGSSEGDATVKSGGSITTGMLTVGMNAVAGSLNVQGNGSVTATSTAVGQNGSITLSGQGSTLNAGNTVTLAAGSTISMGAGTSLLVGTTGGQGLDVGNGGTLQFNLTPQSSPTISTGATASVEANGVVVVNASSPLINSTTGNFIGSRLGYSLIQGTSGTGSEVQSLQPISYTPNLQPYTPAHQSNGFWIGPLGNGTIQTPILAMDQLQSNNSLISTFLIPVIFGGALNLNPVTLTYNPSTLTSGAPANPVSPTSEYTLATIAAKTNSGFGLPSLTITSAVRTAQQQAQIMVNELLTCTSSASCSIPSPGTKQNQVWQFLLGGSLPSTKGFTNPAAIMYSAVSALEQNPNAGLVSQYLNGAFPQSQLIADATSIIQNLSANGVYASNHLQNGISQAVDVQVPSNPQSAINTALSLNPWVTGVGCNPNVGLTGCFSDSALPSSSNRYLHIDLRSNTTFDSSPPNAVINTPSSFTNLANNFSTTVHMGSEVLFNPIIDPANVLGFTFGNGTSNLNFTSVELFGLPSNSKFFNIYVDLNGQWVFEAQSAGNLPYTFQAFGGTDAFEVLFNTALSPTAFDNLLVDVTFDSDGAFNGTLTPITADVPEPSTWAMMILGFAGVSFMAYRRKKSHNKMAFNAA